MPFVYQTAAYEKNQPIDFGLRTYMVRVYQYMALGLGLTAASAFFIASSPALLRSIIFSPLRFVLPLTTFGIAFSLSAMANRMRPSTAQLLFWIYAGLIGVSLSPLAYYYTGESLTRLFFITGSMFGIMSLYGTTTKRDLTAIGSFLTMGLLGLVAASVVNIFLKSSGMQFIMSLGGVIIFTGLTAYDTQAIQQSYYAQRRSDEGSTAAVVGALILYMNFLNLFISLVQLFGTRRSED